MPTHADLVRYFLEAVSTIATCSAYWFFGGRALARAAIDQYKKVVEAQKQRIEALEDQLRRATDSLENALQTIDLQDRRIKRLTSILAKKFTSLAEHITDPDLDSD